MRGLYLLVFGQEPPSNVGDDALLQAMHDHLVAERSRTDMDVRFGYVGGVVMLRARVGGLDYWSEMPLADFMGRLGFPTIDTALDEIKSLSSYKVWSELDRLTKQQAREIHRLNEQIAALEERLLDQTLGHQPEIDPQAEAIGRHGSEKPAATVLVVPGIASAEEVTIA